jgi:hypothetical protein
MNKNEIFAIATRGLLLMAMVMVFNATFHNISVISWWSVLLVEETGVQVEHHRSTTSY